MELNLGERVATVTGAAHGIGQAIAQTLASEGAKVAIVDRDSTGPRHGGGAPIVRARSSSLLTCPALIHFPIAVGPQYRLASPQLAHSA
jgi:NAD(P)-dependent dehydrogenase (short-subunit alcohol dehydrogenase family)